VNNKMGNYSLKEHGVDAIKETGLPCISARKALY
jgi:hypothetical protein